MASERVSIRGGASGTAEPAMNHGRRVDDTTAKGVQAGVWECERIPSPCQVRYSSALEAGEMDEVQIAGVGGQRSTIRRTPRDRVAGSRMTYFTEMNRRRRTDP